MRAKTQQLCSISSIRLRDNIKFPGQGFQRYLWSPSCRIDLGIIDNSKDYILGHHILVDGFVVVGCSGCQLNGQCVQDLLHRMSLARMSCHPQTSRTRMCYWGNDPVRPKQRNMGCLVNAYLMAQGTL